MNANIDGAVAPLPRHDAPKNGVRADTRLLAGVQVPDTPVVTNAINYARASCEPYLFNHVMRSWLFAESLAQQQEAKYDREVLAVTTMLHDIGLSEALDGPRRILEHAL